jgi:predicted dehydrogenase
MAYTFIQVGTGGRGRSWCRSILQPAIEAGRIDPVAAVDVDPDTHDNAIEGLGLPPERCYADAATAFEAHDADFCTIVVPPWVHEDIVELAVEHDCHILSEKPIADTLAASVRIRDAVQAAGLKMGVTMSHRFDRDKTSIRRRIRDDEQGPLDYLVGRFTCDMREYGDWGGFRHEMADPLLIEGGVHQLDFLADMAGERVQRLYADTWLPEWADYDGDCQALVQMRMANGTRVVWEGAKANAVGQNCWGRDYIRAECRDATLVLDERELERRPHDPDDEPAGPMPLDEQELWADQWLVAQFIDWLEGGAAMATNVGANLQSVALVEAAIRSSDTGDPVQVQELIAETEGERS